MVGYYVNSVSISKQADASDSFIQILVRRDGQKYIKKQNNKTVRIKVEE